MGIVLLRQLATFVTLVLFGIASGTNQAEAQAAPENSAASETAQMPPMPDHAAMMSPGWRLMWDGVLFATYNHQGGLRGSQEFVSQNHLMGMATRQIGRSSLSLHSMFSMEPATVTGEGYAELFQHGEAYQGLPVTDRQHPHDFFMQLGAVWHRQIGARGGLTFAGGPVGEPALGPPAFMHRASAAENPTAPLTHHTFDSTHITMGVVTAGADIGPFTIEASAFHGKEPDEHRYGIETGALDSASTRLWWRPARELEFQVSYGFLNEPEQLEPGDQRRANASVTWLRERASGYTAGTIAIGQVLRTYSTTRVILVEGTHRVGRSSLYGRYEGLALETEHLLFPESIHKPHPGELIDPVHAFTAGAVRDLFSLGGFPFGIGADATFYRVPPRLVAPYGDPVSFHVFLRVRAPVPSMGRMWNMTMARPMAPTSTH